MIQQQVAMTQAARSDIELLEHLTRYDIDLAIGVESLTLAGKQVTWYTNNDSVPLDELYFNLFPNSNRFAASMEIMSASIADQDIAFAYELDHKAVKV
ncbi:MAG: hypothetical protein WBB22_14355, partial [Anaerolineae bacterium]